MKYKVGDIVIPNPHIIMARNYIPEMSSYLGKACSITQITPAGYTLFHLASKKSVPYFWLDEGLDLVINADIKPNKKENKQVVRRAFKFTKGSNFSCMIITDFDASLTFHEIKMPADAPQEVKEKFLAEAERAVINKIDKDAEEHGVL